MGEKRNSYIPSRPDEYYGRLGQWISWVSVQMSGLFVYVRVCENENHHVLT